MRRNVLLFDLDGTLVDSARGIAAALNLLRAERGGAPLPPERVRPLVAVGAETLVARGLGGFAGDADDDLLAFRRHLVGVPADPAALYPGVTGMLEAVASAGWQMAIVTNKPAMLARKLLADLDLARYFGAIVGGDTATSPKPSPAPLRHALDLLDSEAHTALFVGDSGIDAAAARACAIPFLLFTGGYGAADCAPEDVAGRFDRFEDLPALLTADEPALRRSPEPWRGSL